MHNTKTLSICNFVLVTPLCLATTFCHESAAYIHEDMIPKEGEIIGDHLKDCLPHGETILVLESLIFIHSKKIFFILVKCSLATENLNMYFNND